MPRKTLLLTLALCAAAPLAALPIVPVSYSITGSPYGYVDDSSKQLTDGIYNSMIPGVSLANDSPPNPYAGYDWVGWSNNSPSINFDFGSSVTIQSVTVSFGLWTPAGVYLPGTANINSSSFNVSPDGYTGHTNMDHVSLTFTGSWTGSNLVLDLQRAPGAGEWMFVDEVSFVQGSTQPPTHSVPEGAATPICLALGLSAIGLFRRLLPSSAQ